MKIIPPDSLFNGQHLEIVESHPDIVKITLKGMGILDKDDQDDVIKKIKILIKKLKVEDSESQEPQKLEQN